MQFTVLIALTAVVFATAGIIPEISRVKRGYAYVSHAPVATVVEHAPVPNEVAHTPLQAVSTSYSSVSISHPVPVHVEHTPVTVGLVHAPVYASHYAHSYLH